MSCHLRISGSPEPGEALRAVLIGEVPKAKNYENDDIAIEFIWLKSITKNTNENDFKNDFENDFER